MLVVPFMFKKAWVEDLEAILDDKVRIILCINFTA